MKMKDEQKGKIYHRIFKQSRLFRQSSQKTGRWPKVPPFTGDWLVFAGRNLPPSRLLFISRSALLLPPRRRFPPMRWLCSDSGAHECYYSGPSDVFFSCYYFISEEVRYLCCSSYLLYLFFLLSPPQKGKKEKTPPLSHTQFGHFSLLSAFRSPPFSSPHLRAEEPQCLLLTFSYHLSPFHHHHYTHLLPSHRRAFRHFSRLAVSAPRTPFASRRLISILPLWRGAGEVQQPPSSRSVSPFSYPDSSFHYGGMIPVTPVRAVI